MRLLVGVVNFLGDESMGYCRLEEGKKMQEVRHVEEMDGLGWLDPKEAKAKTIVVAAVACRQVICQLACCC